MEASVKKMKSSSSFSAKRRIEDEVKCCPRKEIGRKLRKRNVFENKSAVEEYREDDCEGGRIQMTNFSIRSKSAAEECMKNLKSFKQVIHVIVNASHQNKEHLAHHTIDNYILNFFLGKGRCQAKRNGRWVRRY